MTDLISRADAIEAVENANPKDKEYHYYKHIAVDAISALPSADAEFADLPDIPRAYYERIVGNMAHEINMLKEQLESADAVQGEWEKTTDGNGWNEWYVLKCPLCDATIENKQNRKWEYNYCPNCGARMKGGDSE